MTTDILTATTLSMTSREIAELVESRHDVVKKSIERLAERGVIEFPPTTEISTATKPATAFVFSGEQGKRDSIVVVAQLSPEFTARLVDRWQELEGTQRPMSPAEILIHQGRLMLALEREQARQAEVQCRLERKQEQTDRRLDQIETAQDHFTIIGWWRYAKQSGSLPLADAARMGKQASVYCAEHDIQRGEVPDPRFGTAKTYPKWVLDELFLGGANA